MGKIHEGSLLWDPSEERINESALYDYINWLKKHKIIHIKNYNELWNWSVNDIESFWESMWQYFDIQSEDPYKTVLTSHEMPGARWFPEATINYTEHIFKKSVDQKTAIIHASEN